MQIHATATIIIGIVALHSLVVGANEMNVLRSQWGRLPIKALSFQPTGHRNIMLFEQDFSKEHYMGSSPENVAESVSEQVTCLLLADIFSFLWIVFQAYAAAVAATAVAATAVPVLLVATAVATTVVGVTAVAVLLVATAVGVMAVAATAVAATAVAATAMAFLSFDVLRNEPARLILVMGQFLNSIVSRSARDVRRAPATNMWFRAYGWWEILSVVLFSFIDSIGYWDASVFSTAYALGNALGAATRCWAFDLPAYRMGGFPGLYLARKIPCSLYSIWPSLPFWQKFLLCSIGLTLPLWLK